MAGKKRTEGIVVDVDDLSSVLNKSLDKMSEFDVPAQDVSGVKEFISTGDKRLDVKIANRPNGGIGVGLITELLGWEGSGKSLFANHLIANVQADGGTAVLLDTENAFEAQLDFAKSVGVNTKTLVRRSPTTVEETFELIEKVIEVYRKGSDENRQRKVIIVVDSITAVPTKSMKEGTFDKTGYGTDKAKIIGNGLQKLVLALGKNKVTVVFCSQLRQKIGAMAFAEQWTTSGGKAMGFYASTRLLLTRIKKIKATDEDETVIGTQNQVEVYKNRLGPPYAKVVVDVYFDRGIDSDTSVIKYLSDKGVIKGKGWYTFVDSDGVEHKFQTKTFKQWSLTNPDAANELYNKMYELMIMPYRSGDVSTIDGSVVLEATGGEELSANILIED